MYDLVENVPDTVLPATRVLPTVRWRLGTRIAFRFCAELRRVDHSGFRLLQGRFRWVQDYPFNR